MENQKAKVKVSHQPECAGCGEPIEDGQPAYALISGYIDQGEFLSPDETTQLFHTGWCLNSEYRR